MRTFQNKKTKYIPVVFFIMLFLAVAGVLFAVFLYKNDKGEISLLGQARIQVLSNYIIMTGKRLWSGLCMTAVRRRK